MDTIRTYRNFRRGLLFTLISLFITSAFMFTGSVSAKEDSGATLSIPSIDVEATISNIEIVTLFDGNRTWDTSELRRDVGFFVGTAWVGQGGNIVLGGHSELEYRSPTVFYELDQVEVGDEITVTTEDGITYRYVVTETTLISEYDLWIITPTDTERLTLLTCDITSYTEDGYSRRVAVIAEPAT